MAVQKKPVLPASPKKKSMPIKTTESGRVRGALWKSDSIQGEFLQVSINRSYFNKTTDTWVNSHFFGEQDLPDLERVLGWAQMSLSGQESQEDFLSWKREQTKLAIAEAKAEVARLEAGQI